MVPVNGLVEEQGTGVDPRLPGMEEVQLVEEEEEEADTDRGTS